MITETSEVAEALDGAARKWPEFKEDRAMLLRKLIVAGWTTLQGDERHHVIRESAGAATDLYPRNARAELLAEWPE
jgi:hypothetical protein